MLENIFNRLEALLARFALSEPRLKTKRKKVVRKLLAARVSPIKILHERFTLYAYPPEQKAIIDACSPHH